jgi:hypothetical protein
LVVSVFRWHMQTLKLFVIEAHLQELLKSRFSISRDLNVKMIEELDGRAVSAVGVRSRKLSTGLNGQS